MQYIKLAQFYESIEKVSKRLEKTYLVSQFLKSLKEEDLKKVIYLIQGRVFPQWDERKLGMSSRLLLKAISKSTGESPIGIEKMWSNEGDLGTVAEKLLKEKKQETLFSKKLTLKKVLDNITKLSALEGPGTVDRKTGLIAELLTSASPLEAKYIVRTVAETLRTGVGDGMVRDSLVWAYFPVKLKDKIPSIPREKYKEYLDYLQHAFDVSCDFGQIAEDLAKKGPKSLSGLSLTVGKPIKVMLYPKVEDIEEGFSVVGKPAIVEPKLDGFRLQIHVKKKEIKLFTRRLENVTNQFPDVVKVVKAQVRSTDVILDSEAVGIDPKTKRAVPFQKVSQRIRRKYDIEKIAKELPVVIHVFDMIELNGENLLNLPLTERTKKLKAVVKPKKGKLEIIKQLITSNESKAEKFYNDSLDQGHEGIMMKKQEGIYKPGKRVGQGVKVKPTMENLDLVIVKAQWGEGKRAKWLSSFTIACREKNEFKEIGKVGTGIKEKSEEGVSFEELTKELKKLIIADKGKTVIVKPKIVLELVYEEIQKSPSYSSGYALRFPRVHRLRLDKPVSEIATLSEIKILYNKQKKT